MMHLIKVGTYATAVVAIVAMFAGGYQVNAWASDIDDIRIEILNGEKRTLVREVFSETTREPRSEADRRYQATVIQQLNLDIDHINKKIQKLE